MRDIQTSEKYYFVVNRWFAVEKDDGQVNIFRLFKQSIGGRRTFDLLLSIHMFFVAD